MVIDQKQDSVTQQDLSTIATAQINTINTECEAFRFTVPINTLTSKRFKQMLEKLIKLIENHNQQR